MSKGFFYGQIVRIRVARHGNTPISPHKVAPRWPPTNLHPERARCHELRPAQLQAGYGGATAWSQTEDLRSVLAPKK
jgi:hypothetical protein